MKSIFKLFLLLTPCIANAQRISLESAFDEGNYYRIYSTYYNKIRLLVENVHCNDVNLIGENVEILKDSNCIYYVRMLNKDENSKLKIYVNDSLLKEYQLIIDSKIPLPKIDINGPKIIEYGRALGSKADSVFCVSTLFDNYNKQIKFSVVKFRATIRKGNKDVYSKEINGNKFSVEIKKILPTLKYGDKMILENIIIKDDRDNFYQAINTFFAVR